MPSNLPKKVNWNSHPQVLRELYRRGEAIPVRKGKPTLSKTACAFAPEGSLLSYLNKRKQWLAMLRQCETLSRFVAEDSRVHPYMNTCGTETGRVTSTNPNLHGFAKDLRLRGVFCASPGFELVNADLDAIEQLVLAHFAAGGSFESSVRASLRPGGPDIYVSIGERVFGASNGRALSRDSAKVLTLATIYGMSSAGLAESLRCSRAEAEGFLRRFFQLFPEIASFRSEKIESARELGYVEGLLQRRRYLDDINSSDESKRAKAERQVVNSIIQGSAATLFKYKVALLRRCLAKDVRFLLHVHDEILLEAPVGTGVDVLREVERVFSEPIEWFSIPLSVSGGIGDSWASAKLDAKERKEMKKKGRLK